MNLDELRSVRDDARETGELQPLRASFYEEARQFIEELREERDRLAETSDDPFGDPEISRLSDRLESARDVLESIYQNRVAKLLRHAATAASAEESDPPAMTREERELYDTLVAAITRTKGAVLQGESADFEVDTGEAKAPHTTEADRSDASEPAPEADEQLDRQTVRVTADVGTILGIDEREYELRPGDVVALPVENARALIEREAAEAVESDQ